MTEKMTRITFGLVLVLALFTSSYAVPTRDHNDYSINPRKIVCYFGTWPNYNKAEPFNIEDINYELCTHLIYGFAKLDEHTYTLQPLDTTSGQTYDLKTYQRFNDLRKKNPTLTTMISIGSWYESSENYPDMAKDATKRKNFVESAVKFLETYDFDGLDINCEYPGVRKGVAVDKDNFISLLSELKEAFEPHGYLLTAALSPKKPDIEKEYGDYISKLNDLLDWANVLTFDYHGGWENFLGHNAPLYKKPEEKDETHVTFNINYTVHYYLEKGLKKEKFVMGLPFYGRAWTLEDSTKVHLKDPVKGMSPAGPISGEPGVLGYNELCLMEKESREQWKDFYDAWYRAPYAYNGSIWIGYDNVDSLTCKISFLKEMGLSGGMVWSLENDDYKNRCDGGSYPLLHTVYSMLNGKKNKTIECNIGDIPFHPTPPTTEPTTPTTPTTTPTTPTTTPTTPTTTPTTPTTTPTTPTTTPTTPTTTPTTPKPTTPTPSPTTQEPETASAKVTKIIEGHTFKCFKQGMFSHPTDRHKYIVCEYIAEGPNKGWWIHIMPCANGTRWHQPSQNCIVD